MQAAPSSSQTTTTRGKKTLLDLPDELLLELLENIPANELYALSILSRRLHRLALPAYFIHHGITEPLHVPIDCLVLVGEQLNALPGLQLALFITTIKRLSCEFGPLDSGDELLVVIRRLHRLILKVDGLRDLTLDFHRCDHCLLTIKASQDVEAWTESCNDLLTAATKRCTSLTLRHGELREESSQWHLIKRETARWHNSSPLIVRPFTALKKSLLSRGASTSHSPQTDVIFTMDEEMPSALKRFHLQSVMFLLPPHSSWTFQTLNTSSVTELHLFDINLSIATWALILPCITIPTLECLHIGYCLFAFSDLAKFLARHCTISSLSLSGYHILPYHPSLPRSTLPELVSLCATPDNIVHLLKPTGALPNLRYTRIRIILVGANRFDFAGVEDSISRVSGRLRKSYISLEVISSSAYDNWVDLESASDPEKYPVLQRVRSVAFIIGEKVSVRATIPTWLSMFPMLERIEFMDHPSIFSHEAKIILLQQIIEKCPGLRRVKICGETRDIADWLSVGN